MNIEVKKWLQSEPKDYKMGLDLLKKYKINPSSENFLNCQEPTLIHFNILWNEISNWDRIYNQKSRVNTLVVPNNDDLTTDKYTHKVIRKVIKSEWINYEDLPIELQKKYDENGALYNEIKTLHAKMKNLSADKTYDVERKKLANKIVERSKKNRANWKELDYFGREDKKKKEEKKKITGRYSYQEIEDMSDEVLKVQCKRLRIEANLNYVRRFSGKDKNANEVAKRIDELKKWEVDFEKRIKKN